MGLYIAMKNLKKILLAGLITASLFAAAYAYLFRISREINCTQREEVAVGTTGYEIIIPCKELIGEGPEDMPSIKEFRKSTCLVKDHIYTVLPNRDFEYKDILK
jgi:hypothetical protein